MDAAKKGTRNHRDAFDEERGVGAGDQVLELGSRRAQPERPGGVVALARGEDALADAVDALAQPVHAVRGKAIVGRHEGRALVDHPRAGIEVEIDALADEPVLAVEEHRLALGDGLAGGAVDLYAVGDEPASSAGDLDIARGQQEIGVAANLLHAVGDDIGLTRRAAQGQGGLLGEGQAGTGEAPEGHGEAPRPSLEGSARPRRQRPSADFRDTDPYGISRVAGLWLKISVFSVAWASISPMRKREPATQTVGV